jgi:hypothetical protein
MSDTTEICLNCKRTSDQVPLLNLKYTGQEYWVCPQCLPVMIHKPERITSLAGEWTKNPVKHDD